MNSQICNSFMTVFKQMRRSDIAGVFSVDVDIGSAVYGAAEHQGDLRHEKFRGSPRCACHNDSVHSARGERLAYLRQFRNFRYQICCQLAVTASPQDLAYLCKNRIRVRHARRRDNTDRFCRSAF